MIIGSENLIGIDDDMLSPMAKLNLMQIEERS
jgi:hypothetical protein